MTLMSYPKSQKAHVAMKATAKFSGNTLSPRVVV